MEMMDRAGHITAENAPDTKDNAEMSMKDTGMSRNNAGGGDEPLQQQNHRGDRGYFRHRACCCKGTGKRRVCYRGGRSDGGAGRRLRK